MNYNYLFIDVETTGLDEKLDSIIQLSGFLRINGKEVESFNWRIKPYNMSPVSLDATATHGITNEEAQSYPDGKIAYEEFVDFLNRHNLCWKNRAFVVGYNVSFDVTMIKYFFEKYGTLNLWNYIYSPNIDVMQMAVIPLSRHRGVLPNFQLSTVYKFLFDDEFDAHDAMADIRATERIFDFVNDKFFNRMILGTHDTSSDNCQLELDFSQKIPVRTIKREL